MFARNKELEVKYYVSDLENIENRIKILGSSLIQSRTYEYNLYFDTPEGDLTQQLKILRLRKDTANRLTYKGPGEIVNGVQSREEIEFIVSNYPLAINCLFCRSSCSTRHCSTFTCGHLRHLSRSRNSICTQIFQRKLTGQRAGTIQQHQFRCWFRHW